MRNITFAEKGHIQLKGKCSVASVRESFMFEARGPRALFCGFDLSLLFKGILPTSHCFHG
jgi:hypothetical protein